MTGETGAATEKMNLSSGGVLTLNAGGIVIPDGGNIGSAGDTNAIGISSGGVVSISATTTSTSASTGALTVGGGVGIAENAVIGQKLTAVGNFFKYTAPVTKADDTIAQGPAVDTAVLNHTIESTHMAAFMSGLYIKTGNLGNGSGTNTKGTYQLPTAQQIVEAIPGCAVGSSFRLVIKNNMYGTGNWSPGTPAAGEIQLTTNTGLAIYDKNKLNGNSTDIICVGSTDSGVTGNTDEYQVIVRKVDGASSKVDIVTLW